MGRGAIKIYDNLKQRVTCGFPWEYRVNSWFCPLSRVFVRGYYKLFEFDPCRARCTAVPGVSDGFPN
jgi:hypothetical protein